MPLIVIFAVTIAQNVHVHHRTGFIFCKSPAMAKCTGPEVVKRFHAQLNLAGNLSCP